MKIEVPDFQSDERGVSPVIGVILMVAITVILAAVIGAFVLDLGSQLGSSGPTAQISVSDASASLTSGTQSEHIVELSHKGGDDLKKSELTLLIKQDGTTVAKNEAMDGTWETGTEVFDSTVPTEITVGDTIIVQEGSATNFAPGEYTIQIVHKPSNSMVVNSKVDIN